MSLTSLLQAYYKLDEASGDAPPSVGGVTLVANGPGVGSAAGKINGSRTFAGSDVLSAVDSALWRVGTGDFTFSFWMWLNAWSFASEPLTKGGQEDYVFDIIYPNIRLYFKNGGTFPSVSTPLGVLSSWHHVLGWRSIADGKLYLRIDNGTIAEASTGSIVNSDTAGPFCLGSFMGGNGIDGRIDEVAFWKRILLEDEQDQIWNDGDALPLDEWFNFQDMQGIVAGQSNCVGEIYFTPLVETMSTAAGNARMTRGLRGVAGGVASLAGGLNVARKQQLAGVCGGLSTGAAALNLVRPLAGASVAQSSAEGDLKMAVARGPFVIEAAQVFTPGAVAVQRVGGGAYASP